MTATVRKGFCGAGPGPCGAPNARFYPFGWRAECHLPGVPVRCGCGASLPSPSVRTTVCVCRIEVAA